MTESLGEPLAEAVEAAKLLDTVENGQQFTVKEGDTIIVGRFPERLLEERGLRGLAGRLKSISNVRSGRRHVRGIKLKSDEYDLGGLSGIAAELRVENGQAKIGNLSTENTIRVYALDKDDLTYPSGFVEHTLKPVEKEKQIRTIKPDMWRKLGNNWEADILTKEGLLVRLKNAGGAMPPVSRNYKIEINPSKTPEERFH